MGLKLCALAVAGLIITSPAEARPTGWFPHQVGKCGWVHGRFSIWNGSSVRRIWVMGSNHLLALRDYDEDAPGDLDVGIEKSVFGDFLVCALDRYKPGHMQHVRVHKAKNLVFEPYAYGQ